MTWYLDTDDGTVYRGGVEVGTLEEPYSVPTDVVRLAVEEELPAADAAVRGEHLAALADLSAGVEMGSGPPGGDA